MININNRKLCEYCFAETDREPCPQCGFSREKYREYTRDASVLAVGSILEKRYAIGGVIGKGGFGITYLAYDKKMERKVAIKEYYPNGLAVRNIGSTIVSTVNAESAGTFKGGADKFYDEARLMAKFNDNPNIVSVYDFFYENDTVYFTMGFLRGQTLKAYLKEHGVLSPGQAVCVAGDIVNALIAAHHLNVLHRDISPDNIMVCSDGTVKLLDFGAARQVLAEGSQSLSVILKQGFAPLEQYQKKGKQGPWTDIYALGATLYYALTLDLLDDPMSRLEDDSEYSANIHGIEEALWEVIQKTTMLKASERYHGIHELKAALDSLSIQPIPLTIPVEAANEIKFEATAQTDIVSHFVSSTRELSSGQKSAEAVGETIPLQEDAADAGMTMPLQEDAADAGMAMPLQEDAADAGMTMPLQEDVSKQGVQPQPIPARKSKKGVIAAGICGFVLMGVVGGSIGYYMGKDNEPQEDSYLTVTATPGVTGDNQQKESSYETFAYDGGYYEGETKDGKPHGTGKLTLENGNVYEGDFRDGKRDGTGTITLVNGNTYMGEWKDDEKNGTGIFTWKSGGTYTGEWKDGKMNGAGTYTSKDGDTYTGEWEDGQKNGIGKMTFKSGNTYMGEWKDDAYNGTGKMIYKSGDTYMGEWEDSERNGTGTYTWVNIGTYMGDWKDDQRDGTGIYTDNNGKKYQEEWKDGTQLSKVEM